MAGAKLGALSNSQTVRFRYCGISENWGRQTLHRLRKKKAPPKRGRAQGRVACSRKGGISFRRRTIRGAEDSSHKGTHGAVFSPPATTLSATSVVFAGARRWARTSFG